MNICIMCAMDEELQNLKNKLSGLYIQKKLDQPQDFLYVPKSSGHHIILCLCGIGKVNAAMKTQQIIAEHNIDVLINIGVAGGLAKEIGIGHIVVSTDTVQYDFDTTKFGYDLGVIPRLNISHFPADETWTKMLLNHPMCKDIIHAGTIASGDKFVASTEDKNWILNHFQAACVDMESAAIGQVCYLLNTPYLCARIMSDNADDEASKKYDEINIQNHMNILQDLLLSVIEIYPHK